LCRDHLAAANLARNLADLGVGFYRLICQIMTDSWRAPVERCLACEAEPVGALGIPVLKRRTELEVCGAKPRPKDLAILKTAAPLPTERPRKRGSAPGAPQLHCAAIASRLSFRHYP
jgi:hypothetical protein